jgi:glutathione S-transferase
MSGQPATLAEGFDMFLAELERHGAGAPLAARPYVAGAFYAGAACCLPLLLAAFNLDDADEGEDKLSDLLHEIHRFKDRQSLTEALARRRVRR